ncbi:MAG: hypothetical protein JNK82_44165 [Myxococcaceae bacterium]|nr:hypothetical protein [Myxococcaceae bacterium]
MVEHDGGATLLVSGGIDEVQRRARADLWFSRLESRTPGPWQAGPAPLLFQVGHGAAVVGSRAYFVSGRTLSPQGMVVNTPRVFSLEVSQAGAPVAWREEAPLGGAGFFHVTATVVGRHLFAIGGREDSGRTVANVSRAHIGDDGRLSPWESLPGLPEPRTHHAALGIGNRLVLVGGFDATSWSSSIVDHRDTLSAEVASDGSLGPWTRTPLPFVVSTHSGVLHQGFVYLAGGFGEGLTLSASVRRARFDSALGLHGWEALQPLPFARAHVHHTPMFDGVIYTFGGNTGNHVAVDSLHFGRLE